MSTAKANISKFVLVPLKYIFIAAGIASLAAAFVYRKELMKQAGAKKHEYFVGRKVNEQLSASLAVIRKALAESKPQSFKDSADFLRRFVHENSEHIIGQEDPNAFDYKSNIVSMTAFFEGKEKKKKLLSCGPRTRSLQIIYDSLGIDSREVNIAFDGGDIIYSHTFNEVSAPGSLEYFIEDSDYNIVFEDSTGKRIGTAELVCSKNESVYSPLSEKNGKGFKENNAEYLENSFQSFRVGNTVMVNPNKFDLKKKFSKNNNQTLAGHIRSVSDHQLVIIPSNGQ